MPLQNRVDPFGELFAMRARGTLMGNRGGKIHTDDKTLTSRRWASRQWICCVLDFKNRHRNVWGRYYTELFFLDEPTAFAAGHRPCFECRRKDAREFAARFPLRDASAPRMDAVLHAERLDGKTKRRHRRKAETLPDGAFVAIGGAAYAVREKRLLRWTPYGYKGTRPRPRGFVDVLTPPSILAVLERGYVPRWHRAL
ncbi:MAG: hypothetical protein JOZ70_12940 [Pseudolabrys sp.]|nr:hypothetical protein [Pseudolabrys sp.]